MKHIYLLFLCIFVCVGNAQTKNYDFSFISEKSILTIEISNYSDNAELISVRELADSLVNKNSKIIFTINEKQKDVDVKFDNPGKHYIVGPIQSVSDKKMYPFFFNTTTDVVNKTVPISLLVEFKDNNKEDLMETISKILKCKQIEDINKKDIEVLLKKSHAVTIITYIMTPIE